MLKRELRRIRNKDCTDCKLHRGAEEICVMGNAPMMGMSPDETQYPIMVVTNRPSSPTFQALIDGHLRDAGLNTALMYFTSALKCKNFEDSPSRGDVKACAKYLEAEVSLVRPDYILSFGNEPLQALTGHSGIMNWRGKTLPTMIGGAQRIVLPTISPASVSRNPGQINGYMGDLRFFHRTIYGKTAEVKSPTIHYIKTNDDFKRMEKAIARADLCSFDVETTRDGEYMPNAAIVSLSVTLVIDGKTLVMAIPLFHPQSPFRRAWREVIRRLARLIAKVPKRIAQNGKFDARWLRAMGNHPTLDLTFDTMLACHLLDENREKGLKPQAVSRLGVDPWGIDTKDLLRTPIMEVLEYNALDTFYTYHVYLLLRKELIDQPRLLRIFTTITIPASNLLIGVEQRGAYVDRERQATNGKIARDMLAEIDRQLHEFVPPEGTKGWPTNSKNKVMPVNFRPSNFARWLLFDHLNLPVLFRGKQKDDGSPGDPSMAEAVLLTLRGQHPIVDLMLERARWATMVSTFFEAYDEVIDENSRIHTTFKLAGTVTGRLSSGKADKEKITAGNPARGVNLQQVPRDPLVRGIFGAPPGYTFIEGDFSQVELRIGAFISRDKTMMRLFQQGQDIHTATAAWVLGIPLSQVTKDDRKAAKAVNFGFLYGMGWRKFIYTAYEKYGVIFSEDQAQEIRRLFFEQFAGLQRWHARQRRLVAENRRVQNPIGRIRHLPDIDSPDGNVRAEAERQAINSPVQSFGSDLCMLSLIEIDRKFQKLALDAHVIGTVHDALMFEVLDAHVARALPIIKHTMENLPLDTKFGCHIDVPIVADIKIGRHWGDAKELTEEEVYNYA